MKYEDLRKKILNKPEVKRILKEKKLAYQTADMVLKLRIKKGWTQEKLAKKIGTKQPAIARIENGDLVPGLETLEQIAKAFGVELTLPKFSCLSEEKETRIFVDQFHADWVKEISLLPQISLIVGCKFKSESFVTTNEQPNIELTSCLGVK